MDLTEKSLLVGICNWITKQPEYRTREITDPESLFYHVAPVKYAEFIMRFVREEVESSKHGNCTIFDVVGHSGQLVCDKCDSDGKIWNKTYARYDDCDCGKAN